MSDIPKIPRNEANPIEKLLIKTARERDDLKKELEREIKEHDLATQFHAVAVKERDLERIINDRLRSCLSIIAKQPLRSELSDEQREEGDFEVAYDIIIEEARKALEDTK